MNKKTLFFIFFIVSLLNCKKNILLMQSMKFLDHKQSITLNVNEKVSYSFTLHESVGYNAEYYIADESVLKYVNTKIKYHYPLRVKSGMPGSDSATGIFIFKAIKQGETEIIIKHLFRGEIEKEVSIKIKVI